MSISGLPIHKCNSLYTLLLLFLYWVRIYLYVQKLAYRKNCHSRILSKQRKLKVTFCLEYPIHWPIMPLLHASIWRSRVCFSWKWGIQLRNVHKAVWPLAFISEIQFFSWLWSFIWKPPFRATIVLQMLRFTHGYGVLQEQTSQENKKKLTL